MASSNMPSVLKMWMRIPRTAKIVIETGIIVIGVGAVLGSTTPRASVEGSKRGLVQIVPTGLVRAITQVVFRYGTTTVPLKLDSGQWIPVHAVPPATRGTVQIRLVGPSLISWLPFLGHRLRQETITTPSFPRIAHVQVSHALAGKISVTFAHPVAEIRYQIDGREDTLSWSDSRTTAILSVPGVAPGHRVSAMIEARARTWEPWATPYPVTWSTAPYLTAAASTTKPIASTGSLTVTFSHAVRSPELSKWILSPPTSGHWTKESPSVFEYTPTSVFGFGPNATIQLAIPGGALGVVSDTGSYLDTTTHLSWTTLPGSTLRLEELLAEEGYLPVTWTAAAPATRSTLGSQIDAIDQPPTGSFHWEYPNLPTALQTLWVPGQWTVITQGAVMQFQRVNGLTVNGEVSAALWQALIDDRLRDRKSPDGCTYISVTENQPETLELWVNGKLFLRSAANTGISVTPTQLGTYAIYERLPFQVMQGLNPDGVPYADPVHWINYFYGGDAVHGFPRASYGFPQSLGCVELPLNVAPTVYHTVHYGTLVTVNPPGIAPAPAVATGS